MPKNDPSTDELKDFIRDNPNTPLNEFIEKPITVKSIKFDPDTETVSSVNVLETVRTKYLHVPPEKIKCERGKHSFYVVDMREGVFGCSKCSMKTKVSPTTYEFNNGSLIHLKTGQPL